MNKELSELRWDLVKIGAAIDVMKEYKPTEEGLEEIRGLVHDAVLKVIKLQNE